MKDTRTSIAPPIVEAERLIREAIVHFGLTVKPEHIVITIQSRGRRNALGWYWANRWQNGSPKPVHEINLAAESLKAHNMGETLLHELAHAENNALGVHDCTGKRHNKKFAEMARRLGLEIQEPDKKHGFGITDLGDGAKAFLKKCAFKRELFELARLAETGKRPIGGTRLLKVTCPKCGYTVRTTLKWLEKGLPRCPCGRVMERDE